jgi:hypothetical protein
MSAERVEALGGNGAFTEALGLANAQAVNSGLGHLPSQNYGDCLVTRDGTDYVFTFGDPGQSAWLPAVAL